MHVEDNGFGVPAGWYPDPLGLPQLRWWDSQAWTEHTSDARAPIVLQPATRLGFADDELPSRREQRERERAESTEPDQAEPQLRLDTEADAIDEELSAQPLLAMTLRELEPPIESTVDDAAPGPRRASSHANAMPTASTLSALAEELPEQDAPEREIKQRGTYTGAVWVIATLPLMQIVVSVLLLIGGLGQNFPLFVIVAVAPYLLAIGFAAYDRLVLQVWGYKRPPAAWWALLTQPIYLAVRAIRTWRESGRGFAPLVVFGAAVTGVLVGIIAMPGVLIASSPGTFTTEIEQSVQRDAAVLGAELTVECQLPPVLIGETAVCTVEQANGDTGSVLVGLARQNGWISWQVEDWGGLIF